MPKIQFKIQIIGSIAVAVWSGVMSYIILVTLKNTIGIRISEKEEEIGLDQSSHAERAYLWRKH